MQFDVAKLWTGIRAGEEGALAQLQVLVDEVCSKVLSRHRWADSERGNLAEQVMSSTWEYASGHAGPPNNVRGFLKWRARSVLKTVVREWERQSRHEQLDSGVEVPGLGKLETDSPVMKELLEALEECQARLDEPYASVWEARYSKGLGVAESVKLLATPARTIAVQLHRAKTKLRACLEAKGVLS